MYTTHVQLSRYVLGCQRLLPIQVLMTAPSDPRGDMITYGEFELDLCSQVAGIQCPMSAGTEFEGVITWNGASSLDSCARSHCFLFGISIYTHFV